MAIKTIGKTFKKAGFTLVELLVVIAIGAIIATLSISSYSKVVNSGLLTTITQSIIAQLDQARQTAIAQNAYVEVRLYELPATTASATSGTPTVYRAMQTFLVTNTGYTQLTKTFFFPTPFIIQTTPVTHSSLLDSTKDVLNSPSSLIPRTPGNWTSAGTVTPPIGTAPTLPTYGSNYAAVTFRFSPKGNLTLDDSLQWFFTIISSSDKIVANGLPANYATLSIDGFTGKVSYYRP